MNPIFQNKQSFQNNQMNPMDQLTQMIRSGKKPQEILNQLASNNPEVNNIINQIQSCGKIPKEFVTYYARKNNINIQPVIQLMNQMGIRI